MEGTQINDLLDEKKNLTNEEASMVNSIITDLNSTDKKTSHEKAPQITDEEREILMKQRLYQEKQQQQQHQQFQRQQHIQRQQMQQQQQMMEMYANMNSKEKDTSFIKSFKNNLTNSVDVIIVLILSIIFNISTFSYFLKFKSVPFFYDIQNDKSTVWAIILKGFMIASTYAIIKYFIK